MGKYVQLIVIFLILFLVIFIGSFVYQKKIHVIRQIISFDFSRISKMEIWMSFLISVILSSIIVFSML